MRQLLIELVKIDIDYRWQRARQTNGRLDGSFPSRPLLEDYLRRYPELGPGEKPPSVEFRPKGGGLYEAEFPAEEAGSYFLNVQALEPERDANGNVIISKDGSPVMKVFDAARAGVTVPYSPEFADLESNTPLLRRLAEMTGGNFATESPEVNCTSPWSHPEAGR